MKWLYDIFTKIEFFLGNKSMMCPLVLICGADTNMNNNRLELVGYNDSADIKLVELVGILTLLVPELNRCWEQQQWTYWGKLIVEKTRSDKVRTREISKT